MSQKPHHGLLRPVLIALEPAKEGSRERSRKDPRSSLGCRDRAAGWCFLDIHAGEGTSRRIIPPSLPPNSSGRIA
jgi:hypothetical protein